jgi:serine/threonine-protein kinase
MTRSDHAPEDAESFSSALYRALVLPVNKKEEVVAAVTEAWKEKRSLASFVQYMNTLLQSPLSAAFVDDRMDAPPPKAKTPSYNETQEAYPEEEQRSRPVFRNRWLKIGKKVWIALSLSVLGLAVFAGGFVLLVETMSGRGKSKPAESVVVEQRPPQTTVPQKTVAEVPKEKPPAVAPSGNQPIVGVPTLTGMPKEAAEKMALDTGLRYEFFLENDKQAAGTVFKQEPRPNEQVEKGSKVMFWISKGPAPQ